MPESLKDAAEKVLPPPPHTLFKEFANGVKDAADTLKGDVKGAVDDVKTVVVEAAPHNLIKGSSPKEFLPPPPPKPPRPPRFND